MFAISFLLSIYCFGIRTAVLAQAITIDSIGHPHPTGRDQRSPPNEPADRALSEAAPPAAHGLRSCASRSLVDVPPGSSPTSLSGFPYLPPQMKLLNRTC